MAIDRKKGLRSLAKALEGGAIYNLTEQKPIKVISTGIATLDAALGVGGFVRGSQAILYGSSSSGKSALAYTAIAALHEHDPEAMACIVDIERSANREWLEKFGIDTERVYIVQEPTIEDAVNAFQECMRASVFDIIVFDSLGAAMRAVSLDGKDGKGGDANVTQVGGTSKAITDLVNKVNGELIKLDMMENVGEEVIKPVVIYINQVRDVIGARFPMQSMPGGNALHHMAGVIVKVHASSAAGDKMYGNINGQKVQVGTRVMCTVEKNKFAPPRRQGGYSFCYQECPEWGFGIDSYSACYDLAVERNVIDARGAWAYYGTEGEEGFIKTQGRNAFIDRMRADTALYEKVYAETMRTFALENGVIDDDADRLGAEG